MNTYAVLQDRGPWLDYPKGPRLWDLVGMPRAGRPAEVAGGLPEIPGEPPHRDAAARYVVAVLLPTVAVLSLLGLPQLRAYLQDRVVTVASLLAGLSVS